MYFSIVMPLYNKEKYLVNTIKSIQNQTYSKFELIIVNDGSTDDSIDAIKEIEDDRIRVINQENMGVSAARNRGVAEARYDIIAFVDADDEWYPDFLETIKTLYIKYPQVGGYSTAYIIKDKKKNVDKKISYDHYGKDGIITDLIGLMGKAAPMNSSNFVVRKSAFYDVGGFKEGETFGEDSVLFIQINQKYKVAYSTKICSIYNVNIDGQATRKIIPVDRDYLILWIEQELGKNKLSGGERKALLRLNDRRVSDIIMIYLLNKKRIPRSIVNRLNTFYIRNIFRFISFLPVKFIFYLYGIYRILKYR